MKIAVSLVVLIVLFSCSDSSQNSSVKSEWKKLLKIEDGTEPIVRIENTSANDMSVGSIKNSDSITVPAQKSAERVFHSTGQIREDLISFSRQFMGTPYVYAASDPEVGFDCSGFINYVYRNFKFNVPRTTKDFENFGMNVEINKVRKGDLLIFTGTEPNSQEVGHIGIVMNPKGMKSDFIHASSGKANGVTVSSLGSEHYTRRFVKAISVID